MNLFSRSRSVVKFSHVLSNAGNAYRRRRLPQFCRYWSGSPGSGIVNASLLNRTIHLKSIMKDYPNLILSKYEEVELEEYIYQTVTNVIGDPVLGLTLSSLQWLQKRMHITYTYPDKVATQSDLHNTAAVHQNDTPIISIQMELRLPSLLYPKVEELQLLLQEKVEEQTRKWLIEKQKITLDTSIHPLIRTVLQVVPLTKPIPVMAHFVEDSDDLLRNLGPGLTSVAHFVAVYSCKVRFSFNLWKSAVSSHLIVMLLGN
jgi:hypothetical protein